MESKESNIKPGHKLANDKALDFLLAGKSEFTVRNSESGKYILYKVELSKKSPMYFVKANNVFIGTIFNKNKFSYSKKSQLPIESPEVKGFAFVFYRLLQKALPEKVEICHIGKCCRCGRKLIDSESVRLGIGPECRRKAASPTDTLNAAIRGKKKMDKEYNRIVKYY